MELLRQIWKFVEEDDSGFWLAYYFVVIFVALFGISIFLVATYDTFFK